MDWFEINNINTIDSPALIIYKERMLQNIAALKNMKEVEWLRPHVKTNKIAEVCKALMDEGITKFKCATIAEAEMLGMIKAPDVLLAYQPNGPKTERLLKLVKRYSHTNFSCLIDDIENAKNISDVFASDNLIINVWIDLNTGMNRTGITPAKALDLYKECMNLKGLKIIGLHLYDGNIRDTDVDERKLNADNNFQEAEQLAESIYSISNKQLKIVAGGSPTFPVHANRQNVECSPGTFVFWDYGYRTQFPDEPFNYAALVITRVISIIDDNTICVDLGHKSIAAENVLEKRVHFLNADVKPISQSEEHLVLKIDNVNQFKIGDVLYGVPYHICPTVALYERAIVVENNIAMDEWKVIARDKKINI